MKVLVTGAAGFIGSALSIRLLDRGDKVFGIDNHNDYYGPKLKEARLARHLDHSNYHHFRMDIEDGKAVEKIFKEHIYKDTIFVEKGWFATEELSNQYSFPYEDIRYGQILWIANSGVLLSPDFYHSNCNYKGMHGYRPDDDNSFGFLIYDSDKYHPYVVEKDKLNSAFNIIRKSLDLF